MRIAFTTRPWLSALAATAATLCAAVAAHAATTVDNAVLANEADGSNWPAFGRTFSEQHFSPLDQINSGNVQHLGLAWSFDVNDVWNVSSVPVAVDGVIYFVGGYGNVYAVDAVSGKLLWEFNPKVSGFKMRLAWGVRGLTFWNGKIYVGAMDGRLFALDAKTGNVVWEQLTTEPNDLRYITGAPRVFNGKVVIGHGGADMGWVRGYVTAYDAETGKQLWRFYTVPGDPAKGFENKAMAMAAKTWTGEWWKFGGGGTVWNAMTYDPEFNRLYLGTGNGSPWNAKLRSPQGGDNLFLCSIVALDADTGEYVWHYQTNPYESWDFNSDMDMTLATLTIDGKPRKVLMHAPKNGFFYVIDRETGKLISAEKIAKVTWADHIDLKSGRPVEYPKIRYEDGETLMWPGSGGAHNWQPMSFSPDTDLVYIPVHDIPGYYNDIGIDPKTWQMGRDGVLGINLSFDDVPKQAGSAALLAWDPVQQKQAWRVPLAGAINGGVLSTHGGLVFQGQADGKFVAHAAESGATLWSYDMGVGTQAAPITFSANGRQYVSILAGWGGGVDTLGSLSAQHGWVGREHPRRLLTFVLDGNAKLPPSPPPSRPEPITDPSFKIDTAKAAKGETVYSKCVICHGVGVVSGGYAPDLRASPIPLSAAAFTAVVRDGGLETRGMPKFAELSDDDIEALRNYIRMHAQEKPSLLSQAKAAWHFAVLYARAAVTRAMANVD
jgi:quinohemoprotein ethanol dehydrogenase